MASACLAPAGALCRGGADGGLGANRPTLIAYPMPHHGPLVYQPLGAHHSELLAALNARSEVQCFLGGVGWPPEREGSNLLAIFENEGAVGLVGIVSSDALEGLDVELVCAVLADAEGRGIATGACLWALDWAFTMLQVSRVLGCVDKDNWKATGLVERLRMTIFGPRRGRDGIIYFKAPP